MNHHYFKSRMNSSNSLLNGEKKNIFFISCQRGIYLAVKVNVLALISLE